MGLHFILGGSGSGKSKSTYEWLIKEALLYPDRQFMILVPDQYTMQIQKQIVLMHPGHAVLNIDVLSFSRLYYKVMEELGGDNLTPLDDTGKNLILRKLAGSMKEKLPVLGKLLERRGYISEVKGIISEMQQYGISPKDMEVLIGGSSAKRGLQARLEDVQKLYEAYLEFQRDSYRTSESIYPILTRRLKESKVFHNAVVVMDGFTGFTPVQMPLVQEMMVLAKDLYVTMTIEEEPSQVTEEQQLFYTTAKTIKDLERLAEQARVAVLPYTWHKEQKRFEHAPALAHFAQNIFRQVPELYTEVPEEIQLVQAVNPGRESMWLAREVKRLVREQGYQYRDIAVICGNMDTYRYHLQEAFLQTEVPYFIDVSSKIMHNPAIELLQGLLEILERDFSYAGVMRYLRSGFSNLSLEEADLLEIYLIETGIRGRKAYLRPFTRKAKDFQLEVVNVVREKLLAELEPCLFDEAQKVQDYIKKIYMFLNTLSTENKLHAYADEFERVGEASKAREYRQIYRKLMDLFNQMVVLMGAETLSLESFSEILRSGFEELQVGLIPAKADQVLVGDIERTRLNEIKVLFVVGVNDVNIPGSNTKGGMISDMDREYLSGLGLELAPTKRQLQFRQRFYLYQQLTKPSERLYLSYAFVDNTEKEIRPSYFIRTIKGMFPQIPIYKAEPDGIPEHILELFSQCVVQLRKYAEGTLSEDSYETFYSMLLVLKKYLGDEKIERLIEQAFFMGGREMLDALVAKNLYGSVLYGSISRLEQYAACPYGHFLKYGLGLKEPQEYALESADLGNIFHEVLADFGKDLKQAGFTWKNFPEQFGEEKVQQKLDLIKAQYGDELFLDKARNGYALSRASRILKRSLKVLQKHMQAGRFVNYDLEMDFDVSCQWNATRELMMRLKGRIDRVDVAYIEDDMYVKVIDYKSGNKQLELDMVYEGLQMQLVVYMDSAARRLKERYPQKNIHPAAMFYYRVADPVVSMEGAESLEDLPAALLKEQRTRGLLNGDERVIHLLDCEMESSSHVMPLTLKKDGSPAKGSSVCSEEQFKIMQEFMHHKLYKMGSEIVNGHIEKKPYVRSRQEDGCMYCPYKGVCGFDEKQHGYEKRHIQALSDEEVWKKMSEALQ